MSHDEFFLKPTRMRIHPHTTRSRLMLEVASALVNRRDWPYLQARIGLREQGAEEWPVTLFASDSPATIFEVLAGKVQFAIVNPGMILKLAAFGSAPFKEPMPLRSIAVLPSQDQMVFAVRSDTGLERFSDIPKRRFPLKLSLRGQADHALHIIVRHVLASAGFSLEDLVSWGGEVRYDPGMPYGNNRIGAAHRGDVHAIFDEGASSWGNMALELGMRFLPLDEAMLSRLESLGLRRAVIEKKNFPKLDSDTPSLDFSGWPIYTVESTPDTLVTDFCEALDASKERIPWAQFGPLPLARMVRDTPEGHLEVPLHSAAARFWRHRGYLS